MANRILTTHVGSLPRTQKLLELSQKKTLGEKFDEAALEQELKNATIGVVHQQKEAGVDLINDGELGHTVGWAYDYGAWWSYVIRRLGGVEVAKKGSGLRHCRRTQKPRWRPRISWSAHSATAGICRNFRRPIWIRSPDAGCPSSS